VENSGALKKYCGTGFVFFKTNPEEMHADDVLEVRDSKFGKGLFAKKDLPPGTIVCAATGREMNFQQTVELSEKESHALQIDLDRYLYCDRPFLFSNHSCNPNCGIDRNRNLFTLRFVHADEELFWDYSTSMLERHWTMKCACGAVLCRKTITDFDLLPPDLQRRYLQLDIVFPFILRHLKRETTFSISGCNHEDEFLQVK
jgi:hypothetical protein